MKSFSGGIQRPAVIIFALTSFLLLSGFQAFAQENSRPSIQQGDDDAFSFDVNAEPVTFEAVNPRTQVAGRMTITITGAVRGNRLWDGQTPAGSHLRTQHQATFSFVPYYPYSPSYSATVGRLQLAGNTTEDSIFLDFGVRATGSDGSVQWFMFREVVTASEDDAQIAFEQLALPAKFIMQPDLPCGTALR